MAGTGRPSVDEEPAWSPDTVPLRRNLRQGNGKNLRRRFLAPNSSSTPVPARVILPGSSTARCGAAPRPLRNGFPIGPPVLQALVSKSVASTSEGEAFARGRRVIPRDVLSRFVLAGAIALSAVPAAAQTPSDQAENEHTLRRLSIEDLGKIDVTSASRHAEPVSEAAAAVTVITQDDIRRAGITTLPDALRLASGVQVARINGQTWAITSRGFSSAAANKMVVLIDGRSVYTPLFSGVFWDQQDLVLEDIDRIEVIRGPAGALWGANAVNGVINVITRSADGTKGGMVHVDAGNTIGQAAFRHGGLAGASGAYRVYAKYRFLDAQRFAANGASSLDTITSGQAGFRYDADTSARTAVTFQGDAYKGSEGLADRSDIDAAGGNVLGRVSHTLSSGAQLQLQFYYDGTHRRVPLQYAEHRDTGDVDFQYRFTPHARHDLTLGAGLDVSRSATVPTPTFFFEPETRTASLVNVFVQDDLSIVPNRFDVIVGSKFEHNVYTGFEYQPTGRLRWRPTGTQTVWAAVSRAVRMPTRFDSDLRFTANSPILVLSGDPGFQSETVIAYELGYRTTVSRLVSFDVSTFVNDYDRLRTEEPTPPAGFPIVLANNMTARIAGVEASATIQPMPAWQLHAGYTLLAERVALKPNSHDPTLGINEYNDPKNQFWLQSFLNLPGRAEIDAVLRSVGALPHPAVPGYTELTLHAGWRPVAQVEAALVGRDLLHPTHREFQIGAPPEAIRRAVLVQATFRF